MWEHVRREDRYVKTRGVWVTATRQVATALLLLLVLLGPAGLVAHHHTDHEGAGNCVACLLLTACVAALPALLALPAAPLLRSRLALTVCPIPSHHHLCPTSPRAPPA